MTKDFVEKMIDKAHQLFGETSIFEVIDLDRSSAREKLALLYDDIDDCKANKYLDILSSLRKFINNP